MEGVKKQHQHAQNVWRQDIFAKNKAPLALHSFKLPMLFFYFSSSLERPCDHLPQLVVKTRFHSSDLLTQTDPKERVDVSSRLL